MQKNYFLSVTRSGLWAKREFPEVVRQGLDAYAVLFHNLKLKEILNLKVGGCSLGGRGRGGVGTACRLTLKKVWENSTRRRSAGECSSSCPFRLPIFNNMTTFSYLISGASAKICSVLGLVSTLFGLDLDVVVRSLVVLSRLGGLGEKQLLEVDMRLMWTGELREAKKSRNKNRTLLCYYYAHFSHPSHLQHIVSNGDGSPLKCYHSWEYIQFSTGRHSY